MKNVNTASPYVVVLNGVILSAHRLPTAARSTARKHGGRLAMAPSMHAGIRIDLKVGQAVKVIDGMAYPTDGY